MKEDKRLSTLKLAAVIVPITFLLFLGFILQTINSRAAKIPERYERFVAEKFVTAEKNRSAVELEALSREIGIDLIATYSKGIHASPQLKEKFEKISKSLNQYLQNQLSKEEPRIDPTPKELLQFYLSNHSKIEAVVTFLNTNPSPEWILEPLAQSPEIPNLLGMLNLQRVLTLDVLYKYQNNQIAHNEPAFNAMVRLNQVLFKRPELLSQAIGFNVLHFQLGLLRLGISGEMQNEILAKDYRQPYFDALNYEAIHAGFSIVKDKQYLKGYPKLYLKAAAGDLVQTNVKRVEILRSLQGCLEIPKQLDTLRPASWNEFAEDLDAPYANRDKEWWLKYVRALANIDLTSKIVALREYYAAHNSWPKAVPDIQNIRCSNAVWEYEVTKDNTAIIQIKNVPLPDKATSSLLSRKYHLQAVPQP